MEWREVTSKKEFGAAVAAGVGIIVRKGVWELHGSSSATLYNSSSATLYDSSSARLCGSSSARLCDSSSATLYDSSSARLCDSSSARLYDSSSARLCGSSSATLYDSSSATLYDSSSARLCGSSSATLYNSSSATLCDSSSARAAVPAVALQIYGLKAKATGGTQIKIAPPSTTAAWLKNYGLTADKGIVVLFKAVRDDWHSAHGVDYTPGLVPVAADWDGGVAECGGGLHFSPTPWMARYFDETATRYVGCPVRVSQIRRPHVDDLYPNKVKAPGCCGPTFEVDQDGNPKKTS